jgi:hypothetical protein
MIGALNLQVNGLEAPDTIAADPDGGLLIAPTINPD